MLEQIGKSLLLKNCSRKNKILYREVNFIVDSFFPPINK